MGRRCGETGRHLPAMVADKSVYSSEGTGRSDDRVQCPPDLPSRVLGGAESLDDKVEEARRTDDLTTVIDPEEFPDFAPNEVLGRVTHHPTLRARWPGLPLFVALNVHRPIVDEKPTLTFLDGPTTDDARIVWLVLMLSHGSVCESTCR